MTMKREFSSGERFNRQSLNAKLVEAGKLKVKGRRVKDRRGQAVISDEEMIYIKITAIGTSPKRYGWTEMYQNKDTGAWLESNRTGTIDNDPAFEINNTDVTVGTTIYRAERSRASGAWLFFLRKRTASRSLSLSTSYSVAAMYTLSTCNDYNWLGQIGYIAWGLNTNNNGTAQISQVKYQSSPDGSTWTDLKTYTQGVDSDPAAAAYSVSVPVGYYVRAVGTTTTIAVVVKSSRQMTGKKGAYVSPVAGTVYSTAVQVVSGTGTQSIALPIQWQANNVNGPAQTTEPSSCSINTLGNVWSGSTYRTGSLYENAQWSVAIDPPATSPGSVTVGGYTYYYDYWTTRQGCIKRGTESGYSFFGGGTSTWIINAVTISWVPYTSSGVDSYGYAASGTSFICVITNISGGMSPVGLTDAGVSYNVPSSTITALPFSFIGTNKYSQSVTLSIS